MEKFVDLDVADNVIGDESLLRIKAAGIKRHQLGITLDAPEELEQQAIWLPISITRAAIAHMAHQAWSYRLKRMIGCALVSTDYKSGQSFQVRKGEDLHERVLAELTFVM